MPTTEPTPPIRELPQLVDAKIQQLIDEVTQVGLFMNDSRRRDEWATKALATRRALELSIRAALDERDTRLALAEHNLRAEHLLSETRMEHLTALRERAERLRRVADVASLCGTTPDIVLEALADLHEDDYADDLRPRGGDER